MRRKRGRPPEKRQRLCKRCGGSVDSVEGSDVVACLNCHTLYMWNFHGKLIERKGDSELQK